MTDLLDRPARHSIVVLGRQGSGKGEQCTRLARTLGVEHVSTGEVLRAAARDGSPLGRAADDHLERGEPVPDHLVAGIVAERLAVAAAHGRGVVLDGYPRTVVQADRLASLLAPAAIDLAINIDVPRSVAVTRIQNRRVCGSCGATGANDVRCPICGGSTARRADDVPASIGRRMHDHDAQAGPLLAWFSARGVLETVDGLGTPEAVAARIADVVGRRLLVTA